jgi:uncharacterized protein YacL
MRVAVARLLVLVSATVAGVATALALRLPLAFAALAGLAAGGVAVGLEFAVALRRTEPVSGSPRSRAAEGKLIDTSAIIDGRIVDVSAAGFLDGPLVVPRFVLRELQRLADGGDSQKRNRGKRGFDVLQRLRDLEGVTVEIVDDDVAEAPDVDSSLPGAAAR